MKRTLFPEGRDISGKIKNDKFLCRQLELMAAAAEDTEIKALSYSGFKKFYETGSRKEYESEYFRRRKLLSALAVLAAADRDNEGYIKRLEDVIWAVADEFTWALPAHIPYDTDMESCTEQIDLFAAETAFALAEILELTGERLDAKVAERIRYEVRRRVIDPYLKGKSNRWDRLGNNWAAVCAGSVGAAFLYIADEDEVKAVFPRLKQTLGCYLSSFGEDGACTEGINYWIYGFGYFTYFAQLLFRYTNGAEDLFSDPKVRAIALFPQRIRFRNDHTVTFSDSGDSFIHRSGLAHFLAEKYSDVRIPDDGSAVGFNDDQCYRFAHIIRDFAWRDPAAETCGAEDAGYEYFGDAEWYIKRTRRYEFAAKAGNNNESHNHNDVGSFLLNIDGECIMTDPGRGEYTAEYFGDGRYGCFAPSSLAHSVPVINGEPQRAGAGHGGRIIKADNDTLVIGFEKAYGVSELKRLTRTFEFKDGSLLLRDETDFGGVPGTAAERFIACREPVVCDGGIAIGALRLLYDTQGTECRISKKTFSSGYDSSKTVYIVDIEPVLPGLKNTAEFKFMIE